MIRKIYLSTGEICIVDESDYDLVSEYKWYGVQDSHVKYAYTNYKGTTIKMHRLILSNYSSIENLVVDHVDGNGLNNTKDNIFAVDGTTNNLNRKNISCNKKDQDLPINLSELNGSYRVRLCIEGREYHIGRFKCKNSALLVRQQLDMIKKDIYNKRRLGLCFNDSIEDLLNLKSKYNKVINRGK